MKTLPVRAEKAVVMVVDLLADRLQPHFVLLLQRLERTLVDRARGEKDGERLADWMASREALARKGDGFFPAFVAAIHQGCIAAFDHQPPPVAANPFRDLGQPLSLLDADAVDEGSTLAGIAARHESRASHPLMLLGQRFAVLLERPPLPASALPVGPHAIGRAVQQAALETGLGLHARVALFDLYDEALGAHYESTMQSLDSALDSAGVLAGLSFVPLRPKVVPEHPERGRGHAPEPGLVAEIVAMRTVNETLDKMVPGGLLADHRLAERREAVAAMVRLVSRHGPDSVAWQDCRDVMAEVIEAARERRPVRAGTAEWIRSSLMALGYSEVECRRLSEALVHLGQDIANATRPPGGLSAARPHAPSPRKESDSSANVGRR